MRTLSNWKHIGSQICGELCVGGHEVGGDEVPEGEQGDEGGQEGAREEEDLVRWELHGGNAADTTGAWTENTAVHW